MTIDFKNKKVAIYGLGTETERFIYEHGDELDIVGLLDGYRTTGEMYGYNIMQIGRAMELGTELIVVVARPGSCKVIAKRIRDICIQNKVALFDVRGNDLLAENKATFDFSEAENFNPEDREKLKEKIAAAEVVSFDLFDTLIMRKLFYYTDVFELVEKDCKIDDKLRAGLSDRRLAAEKEMSRDAAPKLVQIYNLILSGTEESAQELDALEWRIDSAHMIVRRAMKDIFDYALECGKRVFITTDCYYERKQLVDLLDRLGIMGYEDILVSCEYNVSKANGLFSVLKEKAGGAANIFHVGDDEYADIEKADENGIESFRIYSAKDMYYALGGLGLDECVRDLGDRIKLGFFIAKLFEDPFAFEKNSGKLCVNDAYHVGYLFAAPIITDFCIWMKHEIKKKGLKTVLLCARDGFLLEKLFGHLADDADSVHYIYFLTSRTAAIRAGIMDEADIGYVDSMKYFGDEEAELRTRFGVSAEEADEQGRNKAILRRSEIQRRNYIRYIEKVGALKGSTAFFDFVAKGTTQYFIGKLLSDVKLSGYYFLQLEPEFMKDKRLDIKSFYSDKEKDSSTIFDNYYILETMLTSPEPGVEEFEEAGEPVYSQETRSADDIECVKRMQQGIEDFFCDFMALLPDSDKDDAGNKALDEAMLALIGKIQILDEQFLKLKVEDPFFGRMTDIKDVL